jgi:PAS domain S-box-containing protein
MSTMAAILPTLPELRGLLEVTRLVRDERDLGRLVDRIAETISSSLGFGTVAINLFRPAQGDFEVVSVHGNEAAREALIGSIRSVDAWTPLLADAFLVRGGAYLIPHDAGVWAEVPSYVPDLPLGSDPDAWHPEDALIAPMRGSDGSLLGVVSVDEPVSGLRPGDEELDLLVAFAQHVAAALEGARAAADAAHDRAALARLLDVSASLVELESVDSVLAAVASGIREALEFEKVAVCVTDARGLMVPAGTAGWEAGDPALDFSFEASELDTLFVPEFEVEGCYLIGNETARELVGKGARYASVRNGGGPRAWHRHWLLVPLVERDGSRRGFIWVDDPVDCLLPSHERLQALRTFANQATMALRAAQDFETLNARNRELASLHETSLGLLERLEVDRVLAAIVESAGRLVETPDAYLYLRDPLTGNLRMHVGLGEFEPHVGRELVAGRGASGEVIVRGETVVVDDYKRWDKRLDEYEEIAFRAVVAVPLRSAGEIVGVIGIARRDARPFRDAEAALLERFAGLASLALENAGLYAALQQSEALHRGIVENSTELIALADLDGRVVLASPSACRITGYPMDQLVGVPFPNHIHPDDLPRAQETFSAALLGETVTTTIRVVRPDGTAVALEATAVPVLGPDGRTQHVLATARDITERQLLEEQLRQAQKLESIGRLAGGIAHDFNNLLTAIRGYAELTLLEFDSGSPPTREGVEEIARAADRAAALTGQLLAFSRKQVLRPQLLDLNSVVSSMASLLSRMLGGGVVLTTALDPELRPTLADPTQLEQVVLNLAVNARDAMPGGGRLTIRTANVDLDTGRHVALVVADTGTGMDEATAAQIFEPFFTTKDVGAGTGLGLATVHGIVAQSGGEIDVASEPGVGTTFTVCLPAAS